MTSEELRERITTWAVEVVEFCRPAREQSDARQLVNQLTNAATSAAINYRAACRARSRREFVAKLSIAVEEADETVGWLQILTRTRLVSSAAAAPLLEEARQLVAILAASRKTAARNLQVDSLRRQGRTPRERL